MIMLTRGADMSPEEFAQWWLTEHAPLARTLPGVREIRFNLVTDGNDDVDGIAELWFDDQAAFEAAYATEVGRAVAQDSLDHVAGRVRMFVQENQILAP
jgi:uncharacterized protein (TIGR02118 family)